MPSCHHERLDASEDNALRLGKSFRDLQQHYHLAGDRHDTTVDHLHTLLGIWMSGRVSRLVSGDRLILVIKIDHLYGLFSPCRDVPNVLYNL